MHMFTESELPSAPLPVDAVLPPYRPANLEIVDFRHSLCEVATNGFVHFEEGFSTLVSAEMTREVETFEALLSPTRYAHFADLRNQRIDRIIFGDSRSRYFTIDQLRALPRINELIESIESQVVAATGLKEHVRPEEWYVNEVYINRIPPRGKIKRHQDEGLTLFSVIITLAGEATITMYKDPKSGKGVPLRHGPGSMTFYREPGLLGPNGDQTESLWHSSLTGSNELRWGLAIGYKSE